MWERNLNIEVNKHVDIQNEHAEVDTTWSLAFSFSVESICQRMEIHSDWFIALIEIY